MLKNIKISVHCTQRHPLEGGGRQTVNTRSTFGEALKYFGYNGTNELCGRSMTSKLSVHKSLILPFSSHGNKGFHYLFQRNGQGSLQFDEYKNTPAKILSFLNFSGGQKKRSHVKSRRQSIAQRLRWHEGNPIGLLKKSARSGGHLALYLAPSPTLSPNHE